MRRSDVNLAALSLLASVLIWASVYNLKNRRPDSRTIQASLSASGLDEAKFAVTEMPESVSVTLAGSNEELRNATQQAPTAFVDLTAAEAGTRSLPVVVFPIVVRDLMVNSTQTARIRIEPLTTKQVEIQVAKVGSFPVGLVEESTDTFPRKVYVRGPAEAVKKVANVLVSVNLADRLVSEEGLEVEGKAVDAKGLPIEKVLILASNDDTKYNANNLAVAFMIRVRVKSGLAPTIP